MACGTQQQGPEAQVVRIARIGNAGNGIRAERVIRGYQSNFNAKLSQGEGCLCSADTATYNSNVPGHSTLAPISVLPPVVIPQLESLHVELFSPFGHRGQDRLAERLSGNEVAHGSPN